MIVGHFAAAQYLGGLRNTLLDRPDLTVSEVPRGVVISQKTRLTYSSIRHYYVVIGPEVEVYWVRVRTRVKSDVRPCKRRELLSLALEALTSRRGK